MHLSAIFTKLAPGGGKVNGGTTAEAGKTGGHYAHVSHTPASIAILAIDNDGKGTLGAA